MVIYAVSLVTGEPGVAETLTIADLWTRYADWATEFTAVMAGLLTRRWYEAPDGDGVVAYTIADRAALRAALDAWARTIDPTPALAKALTYLRGLPVPGDSK